MNRKKIGEKNELNVTNYDLSPFMPQNTSITKSVSFENESVDILREKLQIKSEALNLLGKQLELCNKEKNDYKKLIDTLYDKNLSLKKTLYFKENRVDQEDENFFQFSSCGNLNSNKNDLIKNTSKIGKKSALSPDGSSSGLFVDIDSEDYIKVLKDLIKALQKEKSDLIQKHDDLQQELNDSKNDLRLLREQIVRQRVGSYIEGFNTSFKLEMSDMNDPAFDSTLGKSSPKHSTIPTSLSVSSCLSNMTAANMFKENLIKEIEILREQKTTIENDLRLALCQKEEIEIERDSFKDKYFKLNKFLLDIATPSLKPDQNNNTGINLDTLNRSKISLYVDELISQNKYLTESNKNLKEELENLKKCSNRTRQPMQQSEETGIVVSKSKVMHLLGQADQFITEMKETNDDNTEMAVLLVELKSTMEKLYEGLADKLIANAHQRKVNKILAERIQDLERQLNSTKNDQTNTDEPLISFAQSHNVN